MVDGTTTTLHTVMRLMKQPYITYATAATRGQLELKSGINLFYTPAKFFI